MKLVPESDLSSRMTDQEYLLHRAKEEQDHDTFAAKGWLITAQTIYPNNFGVQFEVYKIAKEEKNVKDAAKCLSNMFQKFHREQAFQAEVDRILSTLCDDTANVSNQSQSCILPKIFNNLTNEVQKDMVISAAERAKDTMTYCSLMILFTSNFPDSTAQNSLKLVVVDALMNAEKSNQSPLNPYRQKLVCELLPRLLKADGLEVKPKVLHHLLIKAIEFYIAYATTPSKISQSCLETDVAIEDPWQDLFSAVRLIGWNLGWELASEFEGVSNRELILQRIQSMVEGGARLGGSNGESVEDVKEVLYTTVTIFLHSLLDYTRRLFPDFSQGEVGSFPPPLTLIEAFATQDEKDTQMPPHAAMGLLSPPLKRHRPSTDDDRSSSTTTTTFITVSHVNSPSSSSAPPDPLAAVGVSSVAAPLCAPGTSAVSAGAFSQALVTAMKCWELLHSYEQLRTEFIRTLETLGVVKWLMIFNMDVLIYEGRTEAERQLKHTLTRVRQAPVTSDTNITLLTLNLKLASVLFAQNKFSGASEVAIDIVSQLGPLSNKGGLTHNLSNGGPSTKRHLHLLAMTRPQCLQFVVTLLIQAFRHLIVVDGSTDDLCIGHLVVLLQYEWPTHESVLKEILQVIIKKKSFSYQYYGTYVTITDVLEEFMHIVDILEMPLDILVLPHTPKQRISTRGADRGSKQDFRAAMKRQMLRSDEDAESNIVAFLTRQGPYIPHIFM